MNKLGLVFDSASGITKTEANELGVGFIPLNITINDKEYRAGVDLNREDMYDIMKSKDSVVKTSSPTGESIQEALDKGLEENEHLVYIGISHKWSGTQNAVKNIVESDDKYKGKVTIYDSLYSSPWIGLFIKDALNIANKVKDVEELINILDIAKSYMVAYLSPGDIWWFYKGGRITKTQYLLGSIAKISPVLKFENGAIDQNGAIKARGTKKGMIKMCEGMKKDITNLKSLPKELFKIIALKTNDDELLNDMLTTIEEEMAIPREEVIVDQLSTEQIAHMGPNSYGMGLYVSLENIVKAKLN